MAASTEKLVGVMLKQLAAVERELDGAPLPVRLPEARVSMADVAEPRDRGASSIPAGNQRRAS